MLFHFGGYVAKAKLFCLKGYVPVTRARVFKSLTKIMPILYLFYACCICYFIPIIFVFFYYFSELFYSNFFESIILKQKIAKN